MRELLPQPRAGYEYFTPMSEVIEFFYLFIHTFLSLMGIYKYEEINVLGFFSEIRR